MSFLSETRRTSTLTAERDSTLWRIDTEAFHRLEAELPAAAARDFRKILLRIATLGHEGRHNEISIGSTVYSNLSSSDHGQCQDQMLQQHADLGI